MEKPDKLSVPANGRTELPASSLFRQEALDARQQKLYGEILLIRPLSLLFLAWLGTGLTALVAAVLLWGEYTEKAHVTGVLRASSGRIAAYLEVPARFTTHLRKGTQVPVSCPASAKKQWESTGTISAIASVAPASTKAAIGSASPGEPVYGVVVELDAGLSLPEGTRIEADLPLERRPLLRWIFSRSAA